MSPTSAVYQFRASWSSTTPPWNDARLYKRTSGDVLEQPGTIPMSHRDLPERLVRLLLLHSTGVNRSFFRSADVRAVLSVDGDALPSEMTHDRIAGTGVQHSLGARGRPRLPRPRRQPLRDRAPRRGLHDNRRLVGDVVGRSLITLFTIDPGRSRPDPSAR
jgi:hypothetical protein